jgi:hypothetical protein
MTQALERTALSEGACQNLKSKLQDALREGVALLTTVQQLETDKASLESQLALLQADLSQMVMLHFYLCFECTAEPGMLGLFAGAC